MPRTRTVTDPGVTKGMGAVWSESCSDRVVKTRDLFSVAMACRYLVASQMAQICETVE